MSIDMGPGAGVNGGAVVACGAPEQLTRDPRSLTGRYLAGTEAIAVPQRRRRGSALLQAKNVCARNLKNLTVEIPIGAMTCVTGVSGAGKSTLVMEVLFNGVAQRLQRRGEKKVDANENYRLATFRPRDRHRPVTDRALAAFQSRDLCRALRSPARAFRPAAGSAGARLQGRAVFLQPTWRALRSLRRGRRGARRHAISARAVGHLRGLPRPALQPRDFGG